MLHIVLYQPEIPPNTGNIIRLCANSGAQLHLIHPLGFTLEDKRMRRAGLDYHEFAKMVHYENEAMFLSKHQNKRVFACTTKTSTCYTDPIYQDEDMFLFGPETRGLPEHLRNNPITIPMKKESRSLNLSNAVAIILFEAWRQMRFA